MTCALIGDSIADMERPYFKECYVSARSGAHVAEIIGRMKDADVVIVSAGTNDDDYSNLTANLHKLRSRASKSVIWIVPVLARSKHAVEQIAKENGDAVAYFKEHNGVHPKYPARLARAIREAEAVPATPAELHK